jgi:hypothetical protein
MAEKLSPPELGVGSNNIIDIAVGLWTQYVKMVTSRVNQRHRKCPLNK